MPNYTIPPRLKPSDYTKGKMTQNEIIALQIANDANIAKARKDVKMGEPTPLTPAQTMSPDELLADDAAQEATARANIEKLGFRPQEASAITAEIRQDPDVFFVDFNRNFPAIEADIKKRFNPKLLTPAFFIEYLRQYTNELNQAIGVKVFQPYNAGLNGMINNVPELQGVLPRPEDIDYLIVAAQEGRLVGQNMLQELQRLRQILPNQRDYQALQNLEPVRQQRIIDELLEQFRDLPPAEEFLALRGMIQGDQIDRREFARAMAALVDAIPQGRQENIVRLELGDVRQIVREELERLPRQPAPRGGVEEQVNLGLDLAEEERVAEMMRQEERQRIQQERDREAAQDFLERERQFNLARRMGQVEARTLRDGTPIYVETATGRRVYSPDFGTLNPGQQAAVLALRPRGQLDIGALSDITGTTQESAQSLQSGISIIERNISKAELKATFDAHPELKDQLRYNGMPFDYRDILVTGPPANPNSRKKWIRDPNLNLADLLTAKFGRGIKATLPSVKPMMGQGVADKYRYLGMGVKPIQKQRVMVGKGIAVKETPSYKQYGKYAIHIPQLEQQDILNVKYKSLGQVPKFKPIPVSDIFRDFLLDLLENGKPNQRVYLQIAPEERKVFEEMSIGAGVWNGLGLKRTTTSNDEEEAKRFELLKGEYLAGNNNLKVISELRRLVVKMMSDGRIRKNQGLELLMELSI